MNSNIDSQVKDTTQTKSNPLEFIPDEPVLKYKHPDTKSISLIVSDLHLGYEVFLRDHGVNIPSQYETTLKRLATLLKREQANTLYIVGDLKHSTLNITSAEWYQIPNFLQDLGKIAQIHIIKGNHDGDLQEMCPPEVQLYPASGTTLPSKHGKILLLHGHAWPKFEFLDSSIIITGHIHPMMKFQETIRKRSQKLPIWIVVKWNPDVIKNQFPGSKSSRDRLIVSINQGGRHPRDSKKKNENLFLRESRVIISPAFNPLLPGYSINTAKKVFQGIWRTPDLLPQDTAEVYLLDRTYLGTIDKLRVDQK